MKLTSRARRERRKWRRLILNSRVPMELVQRAIARALNQKYMQALHRAMGLTLYTELSSLGPYLPPNRTAPPAQPPPQGGAARED